jgi:hypothetical protein
MSIETSDSNSTATNQTSDLEVLPNPERGCGFLEKGKAYLRTDVSPGGDLPAFVEFDQPIPFKEDGKRSYKKFPGIQFELSVTGEAGLTSTTPTGEIHEHLTRLEADRPTGTTAGEMVEFHSNDLIMSVGKSYYETVEEFIEEAKTHGVNKGISVTSRNDPPVINPGRTRLFLIHPKAVEVTVETTEQEVEVERTEEVELGNGETKTVTYTDTELQSIEKKEYVPGVFGYTYLTRVVYTQDSDENVPKYIQDYEATGDLDVVEAGPERSADDDIQETLQVAYGDAESVDLEELYPSLFDPTATDAPALEAPTIEEMDRADLSTLADAEPEEIRAIVPPTGQDALSGDEGGVLAVVNIDNELFKVMPSNNVSVDGDTATSVVGPYRLTVTDDDTGRIVDVEKTR